MMQLSPVLFNLGDTVDGVKDTIGTVTSFFTDMGKWCAEVLDAGLSVFQSLTMSGFDMLQLKTGDSTFVDFLTIGNIVANVLMRCSGPFILLFFLYNLTDQILDSRSQMDIWSMAKSFIKLSFTAVLVANAVPIVRKIFDIGALLAKLIYVAAGGDAVDFSSTLALSKADAVTLRYGVSGFKGFFVFVLYLIGCIAIIVCGVTIALAVYQRIYRMFILLPFGAFSFTTYTLGEFKGHEVFQGYLKGIIKTAVEGAIIALAITFSFVLISSGDSMQRLFAISAGTGQVNQTVTIHNEDELSFALEASRADGASFNKATIKTQYGINADNLSDEFLEGIGYQSNLKAMDSGVFQTERYIMIDGRNVSGSLFAIYVSCHDEADFPLTLTAYSEATWLTAIVILLQVLFPVFLAAGTVKEADRISGIVVGGF